ncbi:MAG: hypothetical protein M1840_004545 [Geoglossum simile]|nr:MAG: hypothetical protein M1840_004545 [Geoglossum simile]
MGFLFGPNYLATSDSNLEVVCFSKVSIDIDYLTGTSVVRTPDEASGQAGGFDYVLLCVKALPDVYDLAAVIESVVTPQHTCILVNTTHTLGVEPYLEKRFPTNVVLSLVSGAELTQLGASEFEHAGSTEIWVGPANKNPSIPAAIQHDMADALALTLSSGRVDCKVSDNIRQQQFERMVGPIAFHPASVLFETPSHVALMDKVGVKSMITDIIDELMQLAKAQGCNFSADFPQKTIASMSQASEAHSIMYQDYLARRPMEVETYLGSPIKLAQEVGIRVPRIETLYALLHNLNVVNQTRTAASSPVTTGPPPRLSSAPLPRGPPMNGGRGGRLPSGGMPPPGRRGPPPQNGMNGYPPRPNGNGFLPPPRMPQNLSRKDSFETDGLDEFAHIALYDDIAEGGPDVAGDFPGMSNGNGSHSDLALRERELMLRQRELALREHEYNLKRGMRRPPPSRGGNYDEEDDDDYFDPMNSPQPMIDPDNFDMMSVTSRRTRKAPSAREIRKNPDMSDPVRSGKSFRGGPRSGYGKTRASAMLMGDVPGLHDSLMNNPLMGYSSNRYGSVDRKMMSDESRANSMTSQRMDDYQNGQAGPYPTARRTSQSPGGANGPMGRNMGRPSPPNGYMPPQGRPSPPGVRQPMPRYPPGQGNQVAPQQVEQQAGVSNIYLPKGPPNVRSLTGSASASAESGDSGTSTENSAHSSRSSLGPRPPIGVR